MRTAATRPAHRVHEVSLNVHAAIGWTNLIRVTRGTVACGVLLGASFLGCSGSSAPSAGASPAPSRPASGDDGSGLASDDSGAGAGLPVGDGDDGGSFGVDGQSDATTAPPVVTFTDDQLTAQGCDLTRPGTPYQVGSSTAPSGANPVVPCFSPTGFGGQE